MGPHRKTPIYKCMALGIITGRGVLQALKSHKPDIPSTNTRHMDSTMVCMYDKENAEGGDQRLGPHRKTPVFKYTYGSGGRRWEMGG
jgi:hypothetical protein